MIDPGGKQAEGVLPRQAPAAAARNPRDPDWSRDVDFDRTRGAAATDPRLFQAVVSELHKRADFHYNRLHGRYGAATADPKADQAALDYYTRQLALWRGRWDAVGAAPRQGLAARAAGELSDWNIFNGYGRHFDAGLGETRAAAGAAADAIEDVGLKSGNRLVAGAAGFYAEELRTMGAIGAGAVETAAHPAAAYERKLDTLAAVVSRNQEMDHPGEFHEAAAVLDAVANQLGELTGAKPAAEAVAGVDIDAARALGTMERWQRGLAGGGQLLLTGAAIGKAVDAAGARLAGAEAGEVAGAAGGARAPAALPAPAEPRGLLPESTSQSAIRSVPLQIAPESQGSFSRVLSNPKYSLNKLKATVRAEGEITGSHPLRGKGYRPDPVGGLVLGEHRGHLIPEGGVHNPKLVNARKNIITEAAASNLGPKKIIEDYAIRLADQNPESTIQMITEPRHLHGQVQPFEVRVVVLQGGKVVKTVDIPNG
jgi:hypothetical protein